MAPEARPLIQVERSSATAILTIDNPPVNVLSASVLGELTDALAATARDPTVRVVVLAGKAERAFAAGANIREMATLDPAGARLHGARGQGATMAIEDLPLPVIAAVHGSCLGGGTEVALACDFIIASEDAVFGQPEINLGVMPGWGGTQRLPRRVGAAQARRWILTGQSVPAAEAHAQGLVDSVVPRPELLATALRLAGELATKSATALAAAKYALNHALEAGRESDLAYELDLWSRLFGTPDQKAGMSAFLEKKPWRPEGREEWARASTGFPWARSPAEPGAKRKN
ncbi:MAG TPA: enoyl-CoA hydratase/isomerase family protein [Thermoplasmata archaeon]|nr:enoyl-CoA hydratase/isomerase family protein [Thermoplasmata archaeon]